jgi:hypothetical protein
MATNQSYKRQQLAAGVPQGEEHWAQKGKGRRREHGAGEGKCRGVAEEVALVSCAPACPTPCLHATLFTASSCPAPRGS